MLSKVAIIFVLFSFCGAVFSISPCSQENAIKGWFGTLFYCASPVYTFDYARGGCENGELLAEIRDAYLYQNISNEIASKQGNLRIAALLNGIFRSGSAYFWPSSNELISHFPHTYQYVLSSSGSYRANLYWSFTAGIFDLSPSYLQSFLSTSRVNSYLCLKRNVQEQLSSNPCISDTVEYTFWFGTLFYCSTGNVYTHSYAKANCPSGQVLAEIRDAYLYPNISNEIASKIEPRIKVNAWLNGLLSGGSTYYWPSTGEALGQFPHTQQSVSPYSNYYRNNVYWSFTAGVYDLSPSYLQSFSSDNLVNSFICLKRDVQEQLSLNPCMSREVKYTYWFGTFFYCSTGDVYTHSFAKANCPIGQKLAEITQSLLYANISNEIAANQKNIKVYAWLNGIFSSGSTYLWPSTGEKITQFPHTQQYVSPYSNYYRNNVYWSFTAGVYDLSPSYLQSFSSNNLVNSFLCLKTDLIQ